MNALSRNLTIVESLAALEELAPEWDELAAQDDPNPFSSFAWTRSWFHHFAHTYDGIRVLRLEDERYRGFLPFVLTAARSSGFPVRRLELAGGRLSSYKGPVAVGDRRALLSDAVAHLLRDVGGWDVLVLDSLRAQDALLPALEHAPGRRRLRSDLHVPLPAPYLPLPADYETLRKGAKKSLRQNLSRKLNMAERESVSFQRLTGAAIRPEHLREAQDVEKRSWKNDRGLGVFVDEHHLAFHTDLLARPAPFQVDLLFLRVEGRAIAFQYGFLQGDRYFAYNTSFDSAFQRLSPGMLAINALLQELIPAGTRELDLLIGGDSYKRDWTSLERHTEGVSLYRNTLAGQLGYGVRQARRLLRPLRQSMRRLRAPRVRSAPPAAPPSSPAA